MRKNFEKILGRRLKANLNNLKKILKSFMDGRGRVNILSTCFIYARNRWHDTYTNVFRFSNIFRYSNIFRFSNIFDIQKIFFRVKISKIFFSKNYGFLYYLYFFILFYYFYFGISCSMGYLPNSKGLQGMTDIDEG